MSSSNESDLENNFSKKGKSDKCSSKNGLFGGLREGFSHILPYHFQPEKEENFEETLDNVGYVLINNDPIREGNELDFATISKRCRCNKCL